MMIISPVIDVTQNGFKQKSIISGELYDCTSSVLILYIMQETAELKEKITRICSLISDPGVLTAMSSFLLGKPVKSDALPGAFGVSTVCLSALVSTLRRFAMVLSLLVFRLKELFTGKV